MYLEKYDIEIYQNNSGQMNDKMEKLISNLFCSKKNFFRQIAFDIDGISLVKKKKKINSLRKTNLKPEYLCTFLMF